MERQRREPSPETRDALRSDFNAVTDATRIATDEVANGATGQRSIPAAEYRRRLDDRELRVKRFSRIDTQIGLVRLVLVIALLVLAWLWFHGRPLPWWVMLLPIVAFVPVAIWHASVLRRRTLARRAIAVYQAGLARVEDRWQGTVQAEPRGAHEGSLYAADLDLFGKVSLFAQLSTARTRAGEDTLADWLLAPAPIDEVQARQAAVAELCPRLDLREDAAVLGEDAGSAVHTEALLTWAEAPAVLRYGWVRRAALLWALLVVAGVVFWALGGTRDVLFGLVAVSLAVYTVHRRQVEQVLGGADRALADLRLLAALLERLEREPFTAARLRTLQARLAGNAGAASGTTGSRRASEAISKLGGIGDYIDAQENILVRAVNLPLLYSVQLAYAAEAWRQTHGASVRQWLAAVGELEALLSLAGYSYEHPDDPFPEIVALADGEPLFQAEGLGHPLLAAARCVRNTVSVGAQAPLLLVSGSNMSGKSTLLRAVGLNTVLAMAGGPVRATRLRMTPLRVGASILVNDSLAEGASRFYAEIQRLRAICDLAAEVPPTGETAAPALLFLLDELLEGTNSRDRRVGSEGILRTLVRRGAIGIVSTHDLALTEPHAELPVENRHFEDSVQEGRMHFDYTLRDGVVTRSNGVELMRLVGLDV